MISFFSFHGNILETAGKNGASKKAKVKSKKAKVRSKKDGVRLRRLLLSLPSARRWQIQ